MGKTLFEKIWDEHVVADLGGGASLLHVDRHYLHELCISRGFPTLHERGLPVRNPGLTFATPIPLPEQTLVLGMGVGRTVPNWDPELQDFVPVVEAMFTLSFDHRVLDGGAAGRLLKRIGEFLNAPESL